MARNFMNLDEAIMEFDELSESDSDDMLSTFDESDSDFLDTDIENSESSDEESDNFDNAGWTTWGTNDPDLPHHPFTVPNPGVHFSSQPESELEALQHFLSDELLMELVVATNAHAIIKLSGKTFSNNSVWYRWKDVTLSEMKAYLGVVMNMSMNDKPDVKMFFSRDWTQHMPFFLDVFSRRRFLQIHWMLHLKAPEPTTTAVTRGGRVKNIVNYLQKKCLELYTPERNIAVDESTVGYKGRIIFKTYNPQKPTKWGMRVYVLSDCETGYISCFEPYFGQPTTDSLPRSDEPFTIRIVMHLVDLLVSQTQGSGYHVYTDRFYTSPTLATKLLDEKIHITGTVQKNRKGLPKELKSLRLRNQDIKAYRHSSNKLMTLAWQDKRTIVMLSTWHNANTTTISRVRRGGRQEDIEKPAVVCDYTEHMGAVDRSDHYCTSYSFTRKTLKWWRKLFFWLVEVSIVNSYILYKKATHATTLRHLTYRQKLVEQLVGDIRNNRSRRLGRPSSLDQEERLRNQAHFIAKAARGRNKDCMVCSLPQSRKTTLFFGETCTRKPGLHPGACFKSYHTKKNYKQ